VHSDSSSGSFILKIDTFEISNLKVELSDDKFKKSISVQIDSLYGNLDYRNSLVAGVAKGYGFVDEIPLTDSTALPKMPLRLSAKYDVFLKERLVDVSSQNLELGDFSFKTDIKYNYNKPYELTLNLGTLPKGLNLEEFFVASKDSSSTKKERIYLSGSVHAQTTVSWKSNPDKNSLNNITATLSLEGKELKIIGVDLDGYLNKFERSQNFNLVDIGAVMFAGPVGLAITKGGDYTMLVLNSRGDSTLVNHFYAGWELKNGILTANDVALSTSKSRLSTSGWYNFNKERLDFNIYIIDEKGCSLANQRFYGDSEKPKAGKVKLIKTVLGPITNFFRNVGLSNCEIVYNGRVEAPSVIAKELKKEAKEKRKEERRDKKK
jgi:hypothetical protein